MADFLSSFSAYKPLKKETVYVSNSVVSSDMRSRVRELQEAVSTLALELDQQAANEAEPFSIVANLSDREATINQKLSNADAVIKTQMADSNAGIGRSLVNSNAQIRGGLMIKGTRDVYYGDYVVVPKTKEQVLYTTDKVLTDDILVKEIPIWETSNTSGGKTVYIADNVTNS